MGTPCVEAGEALKIEVDDLRPAENIPGEVRTGWCSRHAILPQCPVTGEAWNMSLAPGKVEDLN